VLHPIIFASSATASFSIAELARPPSRRVVVGIDLEGHLVRAARHVVRWLEHLARVQRIAVWVVVLEAFRDFFQHFLKSLQMPSSTYDPRRRGILSRGESRVPGAYTREVMPRLALLADVPVLPVRAVPEFLGVLDVVARGVGARRGAPSTHRPRAIAWGRPATPCRRPHSPDAGSTSSSETARSRTPRR